MGADSRRHATVLRRNQIRAKSVQLKDSVERPKFVADVMLGRLAKWLRIAGFDVLYSNSFTDDDLVAISKRDQRILLSRDTRLLVRKAVKRFVFLESEAVQDQVRQIFETTQTNSIPALLARCLTCNEVLVEVPREAVRETVPPYVFRTQRRFKECPRCRKTYWAGTHRASVLRRLEKLLPHPGTDRESGS